MIGVLFATKMEAEPFLAREIPEGILVAISGMGMSAARTATEELIEKGATQLINAGVCGALNHSIKRGSVHRISAVCLENTSDCITMEAKGCTLVSVEKPVFESDRKVALAKKADLVDMEGFSVAQLAQERGVPCQLIKGVTDFGDDHGKTDIKKHLASVSDSVAAEVFKIVNEQSTPPSLIKKLHSFTKIEHTIFSLPLLFAGAWLGAGGRCPPLTTLLLIALVGVGARTFGMAVNRIFDRDIDAKNPRTKNRELATGKLSMAQGYGVAGAGLIAYFAGCYFLGSMVFKLSLVPLIPLSVYSLLKRFTPLCHYGIGICLAAAPLGAFVAVSNSLDFTPTVWGLALFTFCWISGFDIIYALMDIDFDRENGVRSIPASLGATQAQIVAGLTHLIAIAALLSLVDGWLSGIAAGISIAGFVTAYLPSIPIPTRFFPISIIAGIAGAFVVLL